MRPESKSTAHRSLCLLLQISLGVCVIIGCDDDSSGDTATTAATGETGETDAAAVSTDGGRETGREDDGADDEGSANVTDGGADGDDADDLGGGDGVANVTDGGNGPDDGAPGEDAGRDTVDGGGTDTGVGTETGTTETDTQTGADGPTTDSVDSTGSTEAPTDLSQPRCRFDLPAGARIAFGEMPINTAASQPITITNTGDVSCTVTAEFLAGSNLAFSLNPDTTQVVDAGQQAVVNVVFAPTASGSASATLRFTADDPATGAIEYVIDGTAVAPISTDTLRINLFAQTPSSTINGSDIRVVDVAYEEAITGLVTDRRTTTPDWTNLGGKNYGSPIWFAQGVPYPLVITHADARIDDGCFHVAATYVEDCSFVPTSFLASIGGVITGDILGMLGVPGGVNVSGICLSRDSLDLAIRVDVNGAKVKEAYATLERKGDRFYLFTIRRRGGLFKVDSYNPGLCNVP